MVGATPLNRALFGDTTIGAFGHEIEECRTVQKSSPGESPVSATRRIFPPSRPHAAIRPSAIPGSLLHTIAFSPLPLTP